MYYQYDLSMLAPDIDKQLLMPQSKQYECIVKPMPLYALNQQMQTKVAPFALSSPMSTKHMSSNNVDSCDRKQKEKLYVWQTNYIGIKNKKKVR